MYAQLSLIEKKLIIIFFMEFFENHGIFWGPKKGTLIIKKKAYKFRGNSR